MNQNILKTIFYLKGEHHLKRAGKKGKIPKIISCKTHFKSELSHLQPCTRGDPKETGNVLCCPDSLYYMIPQLTASCWDPFSSVYRPSLSSEVDYRVINNFVKRLSLVRRFLWWLKTGNNAWGYEVLFSVWVNSCNAWSGFQGSCSEKQNYTSVFWGHLKTNLTQDDPRPPERMKISP